MWHWLVLCVTLLGLGHVHGQQECDPFIEVECTEEQVLENCGPFGISCCILTIPGVDNVNCLCQDGSTVSNMHCEAPPVDECELGLDDCDDNALCEDTDDGFTCTCKDGYTGSGQECSDIDECADGNNGGCTGICVNYPGSYTCVCCPGYVLAEDGLTCEDVNECEDNNGGCSDICKNTDGSFECLCPPCYELDTDGLTCIETDDSSSSESCEDNSSSESKSKESKESKSKKSDKSNKGKGKGRKRKP